MANSKSTRLQVSYLPKCLKFLPKSYHTPEYINDNTEIEGCEIRKVCQSTFMWRLLVALEYSAYQSGTHLNYSCYQNGTQFVNTVIKTGLNSYVFLRMGLNSPAPLITQDILFTTFRGRCSFLYPKWSRLTYYWPMKVAVG